MTVDVPVDSLLIVQFESPKYDMADSTEVELRLMLNDQELAFSKFERETTHFGGKILWTGVVPRGKHSLRIFWNLTFRGRITIPKSCNLFVMKDSISCFTSPHMVKE